MKSLHSIADFEALRSVPDDELMHRLTELVTQDRRVEADLVAHIGEVEERRLFARRAFPSMFVYCTRALHLSEAEAYRRIHVARAARRFEGLLDMLRDGRLHLTGMALIVPVLKPENLRSVLARATHRSKREIQRLVAELSPRPDIPAVIRKLPRKRLAPAPLLGKHPNSGEGCERIPETVDSTSHAPEAALVGGRAQVAPGSMDGRAAGTGPDHSGSNGGVELFPGRVEASSPLAPPSASSQRPVVEPLSPARYKVQFTASQELRDMLERLSALMRSEVPDGDLAAIIERAVSEKLQRLEARRFGKTKGPRKTLANTVTKPGSRNIPAALRRAVYERDESRCRFVDDQGRRCSERHQLEFHHHFPFGKGGDLGLNNIRLLCKQHNRLLAEVDYGKATVQAKVDASRRLAKERRQLEGATGAATNT